ncbi:DNA (cytosine-5)-methyltransferase 1 [Edaphobacter lichenicola]|uniref:DNA (cytosine-5-)-methyltransferase n=2 Tax=Tunturiibacter empetritectus TaxID=3069691 RepID=A0A7W8MU42_9BACT|nr:DNA (cytosine-5)-methyltransferase 1 [Edaphobacter lichenicola]
MPHVEVRDDVRQIDRVPKGTDLLVAGFPCQDLSQVGRARGIAGDKSGIVDHVFRILQARRTQWVLLENVPFMLQLHKGAAMKHITGKLERLGYSWAYRTVDTRSFGLPQRRERVFLLASLDHVPWNRLFQTNANLVPQVDITPPCGFYWTEGNRGIGWAANAIPTLKGGSAWGIPSAPAIWLPDHSFVTPDIRDAERLQGFKADWTKPAESVSRPGHRWRLVGNAVTCKVSEWVGSTLLIPDKQPPELEELRPSASWPAAAAGENGQRYRVLDATKFPVAKTSVSIESFLRYEPRFLSHRAASGFLSRLEVSGLRYPPAFAKALRSHIRKFK